MIMRSFVIDRNFRGFSNLSVALHTGGSSFFTASVVIASAIGRLATIYTKSQHSAAIHFGEALGWHIDGSTDRLPPMWPWFVSRRRHHRWVEIVVMQSSHYFQRFFSWYSGYFLSIKINTSKFQFNLRRTNSFQRAHKNP